MLHHKDGSCANLRDVAQNDNMVHHHIWTYDKVMLSHEDVATPSRREVAPWRRCCTLMDHLGTWCAILITLLCQIDLCFVRRWSCLTTTPCCATMMDVGPLVLMMRHLYIMMLHYGTRCSIMCVLDAHGLYAMEECSRRWCMVDCDWLAPFMGL